MPTSVICIGGLRGSTATSDLVCHSACSKINRYTQGVLVGTWQRPSGEYFFTDFTLETFTQPSLHAWSNTYSSISLRDLQGPKRFFIFRNYSFTISFFNLPWCVIKRSLGGESAFGHRLASSMSKCSASKNSDLGNASSRVEIRDHDTNHVDRYG